MEEAEKKGRFEMSFETRQLIDMGTQIKEGELWTYAAMSEKLGFQIQGKHWLLGTARHYLQSEYGIIFDTVIGNGVKRMSNAEKPKIGEAGVEQIHRKVKRIGKALATIDFGTLTPEGKTSVATSMTVVHMVGESTKSKTIKRIETAIGNSGNVLPLEKTIALFEK